MAFPMARCMESVKSSSSIWEIWAIIWFSHKKPHLFVIFAIKQKRIHVRTSCCAFRQSWGTPASAEWVLPAGSSVKMSWLRLFWDPGHCAGDTGLEAKPFSLHRSRLRGSAGLGSTNSCTWVSSQDYYSAVGKTPVLGMCYFGWNDTSYRKC